MIRAGGVWIVAGVATLYFGSIAIIASLLRVRGGIYSWATRKWARTILGASNTPLIIHGLDNVRPDEPQVVVSNHASAYDIFAIAAALPVPFSFVAKKELERILFFGTAWKAAGHISIDRSNRQKAILSLQQAGEKIRRENGTVIIFPEGTRSRRGELLEFKKGAFTLAASAQVAIIPTVVIGSRGIVRKGGAIRPQPIHVRFGDRISPAGYTAQNLAGLIEQVRARMLEMLQQPTPSPLARRGSPPPLSHVGRGEGE